MFVVVRNQNNGEEDLYTAPITANRAAYQTEATPIDLGQINQGAMAGAYTANAIGPQMKEPVRDARILQRFGDRKTNSDGKAAFNEAVNRQLAEGYRWVGIPCRPANPDVPAVTIDAPNGRKLVCSVLRK